MNTYKLIRHANNTFNVDISRDYFTPLSNYYLLAAHDIIEHTEIPHPNDTVDELLAVGAMLSGRANYNSRGLLKSQLIEKVGFNVYKIFEELGPLFEACVHDYTCETYFKDVHSSIEIGFAKHIKTQRTSEKQIFYNSVDITNWIFHGQKLFLERFDNPRDVSTTLFDSIQTKIREWHVRGKGNGLLYVDFDTLRVNLSFTRKCGGATVI